MKKILIILISFAFACNSQNVKQEKVVIDGFLNGSSNDTLYFSVLHFDKITDTDTIITGLDGRFKHEFQPTQCQFYVLVHKGYNYVRLLIDKGEQISFKADIKNIPETFFIEGSKGSTVLNTIEKKLAKANFTVDSLTQIVNQTKDNPDFNKKFPILDSVYRANFKNIKDELKQIIQGNMTSLASIVALFSSLAGQNVFNELNEPEVFNTLHDSLYPLYPENSFAIALHNKVLEMKLKEKEKQRILETLQIGLEAPDFKIMGQHGKIIQLSLLRGKVVLLKFWDSHCTTCQAENLKLKETYNKFKNKGFEIFAISEDINKDEWLSYLQKYNFNWLHAWLYEESQDKPDAISKLYYIDEIPIGYLIDREGKFIEIDIKNKDLESVLEKIL